LNEKPTGFNYFTIININTLKLKLRPPKAARIKIKNMSFKKKGIIKSGFILMLHSPRIFQGIP
jgi:hypothetical protein